MGNKAVVQAEAESSTAAQGAAGRELAAWARKAIARTARAMRLGTKLPGVLSLMTRALGGRNDGDLRGAWHLR